MVMGRDEGTSTQQMTEQRTTAEEQRRQGEGARALDQAGMQFPQQPPLIQPLGFFASGPEVSRVGMRMPEFTPADPELWFGIVDRSFQAAGITVDATKFGYALTAIGPKYTMEVRDIIMNPPMERAYETLKSELIKRLSLSQEHKTRRLLEHEEIGDRKPSQFLRHLRSLAGNVVGDPVLRTIWLSRLPTYIQPHLVTRTADTVDQLADIADAIVEATRAPTMQIAETARPLEGRNQVANDATSIEAKMELRLAQMRLAMQQEMAEQLTAIRRSIEAIGETRSRERYAGNQRSRSRSRSRSRNARDQPASGVCWYHWKFGAEARQCRAPCSAQQAGNAVAGR